MIARSRLSAAAARRCAAATAAAAAAVAAHRVSDPCAARPGRLRAGLRGAADHETRVPRAIGVRDGARGGILSHLRSAMGAGGPGSHAGGAR